MAIQSWAAVGCSLFAGCSLLWDPPGTREAVGASTDVAANSSQGAGEPGGSGGQPPGSGGATAVEGGGGFGGGGGEAALPDLDPCDPDVVAGSAGGGGTGGNAGGPIPSFFEQGGIVRIEAEAALLTSAWLASDFDPGHAGSGYVCWVGNNKWDDTSGATLNYHVTIQQEGDYFVIVRSLTPGSDPRDHNDVWMRVATAPACLSGTLDDNGWTKIKAQQLGGWVWDTELGSGGPPHCVLPAGTHLVQLAPRSPNFHIDRIHLYRAEAIDDGLDPWDHEAPPTSTPPTSTLPTSTLPTSTLPTSTPPTGTLPTSTSP